MNEAFSRSIGIINPNQTKPVAIIGCGSIGSGAALALAKMGFRKFILYDGDYVGPENIGCQMFGWSDVGQKKTEALKRLLIEFSPLTDEDITCYDWVDAGTVFSRILTVVAVDSMKVRSLVWAKARRVPFLVDGRIGGQTIRVFSVIPTLQEHREFYEETLYSDEEASELPCTQRNVADVAFFVAGMVARAVRRYTTDKHIIKETALDALTFTTYKVGEEGETLLTKVERDEGF